MLIYWIYLVNVIADEDYHKYITNNINIYIENAEIPVKLITENHEISPTQYIITNIL